MTQFQDAYTTYNRRAVPATADLLPAWLTDELLTIQRAVKPTRSKTITFSGGRDNSPYTANVADGFLLVDNTLGAVSILLPTATRVKEFSLTIKKIDNSGNAVTITPMTSTIDGASSVSILQQYGTLTIRSNGAQYYATVRPTYPALSTIGTLTFGSHLQSGSLSSFNGSANVTIATDATSSNVINTIVARDGGGNFSANIVTGTNASAAQMQLLATGIGSAKFSFLTNSSLRWKVGVDSGNTDLWFENTVGGVAALLTQAGKFSAVTLDGTLVTAAQPNVTSVGTLVGLTVTGANTAISGTAFTVNNSTGAVGMGFAASVAGVLTVGPNNTTSQINLGPGPSANAGGRILFNTSNSVTNWQITSNLINGGGLDFTPSTAGGGSTFTTPTLTLLAGAATVNSVLTVNNTVAAGVADVFAHSTGGTGDIARLRLQTSTAHWYTQTIQGVGAYAIGVVGTGDWLSIATGGGTTLNGSLTVNGTTVTVSGTTSVLSMVPSTATNAAYSQWINTGGTSYVGIDNSAGSTLGFGAYNLGLFAPASRQVRIVSGGALTATFDASNNTQLAGTLAVTGQISSSGSFRLNASNGVAILQNGYTSNESGISAQNAAGNADASFYIGGFSTARYVLFTATGSTVSSTLTGNADIKLATVGSGYYAKEGTNATMGVATLSTGTIVVATTKVTASSRIFVSRQDDPSALGVLPCDVTTRVAGTSFTIKSSNPLDNATVAWIIFEPS